MWPERRNSVCLASGGVYHAAPVTGSPVRSYRTVSPLPARRPAVCSLWHCPSGRPDWMLSSACSG